MRTNPSPPAALPADSLLLDSAGPGSARPPSGWALPLLALGASLYFSLVCNGPLWQQLLSGRDVASPGTWATLACLFVAVTAFQWTGLLLLLTRRNARWVLSALLIAAALAAHFMRTYAVYLDPDMLRNVLRTDLREAGELMSWRLARDVLVWGVLPAALLWKLPLARVAWQRALPRRLAALGLALGACVAAVLLVFQDVAALARNQRELRFLVTPVNALYSLARVGAVSARGAAQAQQPIATDARLGPAWAQPRKPMLLVLVVGETARAANWGLNGYARQTTPQLAALDVLNFRDVTACGTNTETSVPCMFSPWGRRDYDEARIRGHQSLLHVIDRVSIPVLWRDNQSGCKGVCSGLAVQTPDPAQQPALCSGEHCLDEVLLQGLDGWLGHGVQPVAHGGAAAASRVLVLHPLGSHGPAYSRRYPAAFRHFTPACEDADLRRCSPAEIVNAYDNSLLYTDHLLAQTIRWLQQQEDRFDTGLIYVSDHGESLGEHNLFLHGLPRAIAPREQTHVPMVMWWSASARAHLGLDLACLRARHDQPLSHDHLFHSVLGLLDVQTGVYDAALDLTRPCRSAPPGPVLARRSE